jgi:hypothetical protein
VKSVVVGGMDVQLPIESSTLGGSVGRRDKRDRLGFVGCLKTC